jgi:uncharacterized membrane protein YhdT
MNYAKLEPIIIVLIFSLLVGWVGSKRKIGFWKSFILSCLATPLLGIIFTLFSKRLKIIEKNIPTKSDYDTKVVPIMVFTKDHFVSNLTIFKKGDIYPVYNYDYEKMVRCLKIGLIKTL